MDEARRRAIRTAHTNHVHTCVCGRKVRGNGGWASHRWACEHYQAWIERFVDEYGYVPRGDVNVRRYPRWSFDRTRCRWIESGLS